jgi:chloride channel protein, CIC family
LQQAAASDMPSPLVRASDLLLERCVAVARDDNLLEALREFGDRDLDSLPVLADPKGERRLVGLLFRADVMRRYRKELLDSGKISAALQIS